MNPPDPLPPRAITLYTPAAIGLLASVAVGPPLCFYQDWTALLGARLEVFAFSFLFCWPFVLGAYHGYRFLRGLFGGHRLPPADHV